MCYVTSCREGVHTTFSWGGGLGTAVLLCSHRPKRIALMPRVRLGWFKGHQCENAPSIGAVRSACPEHKPLSLANIKVISVLRTVIMTALAITLEFLHALCVCVCQTDSQANFLSFELPRWEQTRQPVVRLPQQQHQRLTSSSSVYLSVVGGKFHKLTILKIIFGSKYRRSVVLVR